MANGEVTNPDRIIRVQQLAEFKRRIEDVFLQSIEFSQSGKTLQAGVNGGEKQNVYAAPAPTKDEVKTALDGLDVTLTTTQSGGDTIKTYTFS